MQAVHRRAGRSDLEVSVDLESDRDSYVGLTKNIGAGAVFVAMDRLHRIGDRLRLRFALPGGGEPIAVEAEVRWIRESPQPERRDQRPSIGLRFVDLPLETSARVQKVLRDRDPAYREEDS
jgi:uncharacterized protein (TIGR02266 family)